MIKQKVILEVKIGERFYALECSHDSPFGELHDALSQMKAYIIQRMAEAEQNKDTLKKEE